jgi:hypothetical protein
MEMQAGGRCILSQRVFAAYCVEGVDAVVNMHFVAAATESLAEPVHIGRVTAKAVTAKERGDHAKLHRRPPVA